MKTNNTLQELKSQLESHKKLNIQNKRWILDPITNKAIANPDWTAKDEANFKALLKTPWVSSEKKLLRLQKANHKKKVELLFSSKLPPQEFLDYLEQLKSKTYYNKRLRKQVHTVKFYIIKFFHYAVYVLKMTSLHQTQRYIAKQLKKFLGREITREWVNKKIAELCSEGIFTKLYRHLCSCLYSMNHLFFDMFYASQLNSIFGYIFYSYNTCQQRLFTQQVSTLYKNINYLASLFKKEEKLAPKRENTSKLDLLRTKTHENTLAGSPGFCLNDLLEQVATKLAKELNISPRELLVRNVNP